MAIDARIPLGVQPVQQQPNMLAQYAQIMGIKAAQQEMQGSEDLRAAYASGGDLNDPEFRRRVMAANPKLGSELIKRNAETGKLQNEAILKRIELSREMLTGVNTPEDYIAWHESNHKDPVLGGYLTQRGVTAEQSRAKIIADLSKPGGLDKLKRESALGAGKLQQELMQTERTRISSGPAYGQLDLARKKDAREQAELDLIRGVLTGGVTPPATAPVAPPMGGGGGGGVAPITSAGPVPMGAAPAPAAVPSVVAQTNVLADQVAPQAAPTPNVNALNPNAQQPQLVQQISQLIRLGTPKALQAADALVKEYNILNPAGKIEQDANGNLITVNERTRRAEPVIGPDGKPVKGSSPYESAFTGAVGKLQADRNEKVVTAAQSASANIQKIDSAIELLKTGDTTTGLGAELRTNIDRARALFAGDIKAGKKVADTQILDALLGSDVFSMIQSLGIGARGLDTPAERDYLRQVMTGTIQMDNKALVRLSEIRRNIEVRAIEKYNTQLEKGELNKFFETQGIKPEKIEIPSAPGASGTMVSTPDGRNIVFPDAASAAKFRKEAGL
jgi:hypothetical protein